MNILIIVGIGIAIVLLCIVVPIIAVLHFAGEENKDHDNYG